MVERNGPLSGLCGNNKEVCCVSVNKIFDSAKDKDCLEDIRVHLCDWAQEVIDKATAVRTKSVEVVNTNISIETVPFNRGFFQVTIRYYFCITLEACICNGRVQEVKGLAAFDKKIILFGGEKNVAVFTSNPEQDGFCDKKDLTCDSQALLPTVTVEVAQPIALDTKLVDKCKPFGHCCVSAENIPDKVRGYFDGNFCENMGMKSVFVTLGVFSIIRMEREVQLILPACNFCLPDKESAPANTSDPCNMFGKMNFPISEFFPFSDEKRNKDKDNNNNNCCK